MREKYHWINPKYWKLILLGNFYENIVSHFYGDEKKQPQGTANVLLKNNGAIDTIEFEAHKNHHIWFHKEVNINGEPIENHNFQPFDDTYYGQPEFIAFNISRYVGSACLFGLILLSIARKRASKRMIKKL